MSWNSFFPCSFVHDFSKMRANFHDRINFSRFVWKDLWRTKFRTLSKINWTLLCPIPTYISNPNSSKLDSFLFLENENLQKYIIALARENYRFRILTYSFEYPKRFEATVKIGLSMIVISNRSLSSLHFSTNFFSI